MQLKETVTGKDDGRLQGGYLHGKENVSDVFEYLGNFPE